MEKIATVVDGAYILKPNVFGDNRGYFMESYSLNAFTSLGITPLFVQDNESFTQKAGTLRGIHFQNNPISQCKVVRVTSGAVKDLVVDLRRNSPTYLKWQLVELSEDNHCQLYIPKGCGHGFLTLTDNVKFCYKVDAPYSKEHDRSIRFDDPTFSIDWGIENPIMSEKDLCAPYYVDSDCNFTY